MLNLLRTKFHYGSLYIPNPRTAVLPAQFMGLPKITDAKASPADLQELVNLCPTKAISIKPLRIDLGKCIFCGDCARRFPKLIQFTNYYKMATTVRSSLIVDATTTPESFARKAIQPRRDLKKIFGRSLKLRQVSAAGNNADEMELNACGNVNFDMGRYGVEFVASPRHADGVVITGPISENMAKPLQDTYDAIPDPKIIILAGAQAISGGLFEGSPALNRTFLQHNKVDLYVPGNPIHPLTFINGVLDMLA